jgi:spore maturation protein CgeB
MIYKDKKILIIGSPESYTLEKMYYRAFKKLGTNVSFFNATKVNNSVQNKFIEKFFYKVHYFFIRKKLNKFFLNKKFDLVIFFKGLYLNKFFLLNLKKKSPNTKFINIYPDDPFQINKKNISNKNILDSLSEFNFFFIWSKKILKKLKKKFNNEIFFYLPFGYDEFLHIKTKINKKYENKINFVGSHDFHRDRMLGEIDKKDLIIFGNNWKDKFQPIFGKKLSTIIGSSLASINILRKQNITSHNMRTFEVPAMGGLLLTTRSKEQQFYFKDGIDCLMYSSLNELKNKIKFIKKNKKKILDIKKNAYKKSKIHSYTNRSKFILNIIFKNDFKKQF